ncbi:hypothetical protein NEFER03_0354 [Nematocida sp. LUAm3]|nr:hypothetical protein NEFER03_0354 [Nematocida sp. LUAm3]KAI5175456.1 hypothetical protein NEFER02_1362 [Nematocida sp. LUAm2]KAI5178377.1 hypothetical protein NEFER01_1524 [Nematocida sp. LUAm1]
MEEQVNTFCQLLRENEREKIFLLLTEYLERVERFSTLFVRAQEYKLLLQLSKAQIHSKYLSVKQKTRNSLLLGGCCGILAAGIFLFIA